MLTRDLPPKGRDEDRADDDGMNNPRPDPPATARTMRRKGPKPPQSGPEPVVPPFRVPPDRQLPENSG